LSGVRMFYLATLPIPSAAKRLSRFALVGAQTFDLATLRAGERLTMLHP
jgi:hypothetical protein